MGADSLPRVVLANGTTGADYVASGGGGGGGTALTSLLFTDSSGAVYVRHDDGTTVGYVTPAGILATPGAGLRPYSALADGASVTLGTTTDGPITNPASTGTLLAFIKGVASLLATVRLAVQAAKPDVSIASGTIDPTTLNSAFPVTPNGNGTVVLKIGTLGTAFPGGTVVSFEAAGVTGAAPIAVNVYPRGASNSGRIKSTTVGGEFIFEAAGAALVQARVSTVGTGGTLAVVANMTAPTRVQATSPVSVGQTTRLFAEASSQKVVTSATDALATAISASEVEVNAVGAALWYNRNAAAVAGAGSRRLAADERAVIQITPGDVIHVIQDTAAGYAVLTPVA